MRCVGHFDNSTSNPNNPDPSRTVTFGEMTNDEMLIGYMNVALDYQDLRDGAPKVVPRPDGKFDVTFRHRPPKGVKTVRLAAGFNDDFSPVQELVGPDTNGFFTVTVTIPVGYYKYKIVHDRQKYRHDPGNWREFGFLHDSLLTVGSPMGPPPRKPTHFLVPFLEATLGTRSMPAALTRTGHNITLVRGSSPGT